MLWFERHDGREQGLEDSVVPKLRNKRRSSSTLTVDLLDLDGSPNRNDPLRSLGSFQNPLEESFLGLSGICRPSTKTGSTYPKPVILPYVETPEVLIVLVLGPLRTGFWASFRYPVALIVAVRPQRRHRSAAWSS